LLQTSIFSHSPTIQRLTSSGSNLIPSSSDPHILLGPTRMCPLNPHAAAALSLPPRFPPPHLPSHHARHPLDSHPSPPPARVPSSPPPGHPTLCLLGRRERDAEGEGCGGRTAGSSAGDGGKGLRQGGMTRWHGSPSSGRRENSVHGEHPHRRHGERRPQASRSPAGMAPPWRPSEAARHPVSAHLSLGAPAREAVWISGLSPRRWEKVSPPSGSRPPPPPAQFALATPPPGSPPLARSAHSGPVPRN
jgi:hypothetical protein